MPEVVCDSSSDVAIAGRGHSGSVTGFTVDVSIVECQVHTFKIA